MKLEREPVLVAQIVAAVVSILSLLVALGVIQMAPEQLAEIERAVGAVLVVVVPLIAALWGRDQVTPLVDPRDEQGAPLTREGWQ